MIKGNFSKFLEELHFGADALKCLTEFLNADIFFVTLLKSDFITFRELILLEKLTLTGNICSGVRFQYSYISVGWTARTS